MTIAAAGPPIVPPAGPERRRGKGRGPADRPRWAAILAALLFHAAVILALILRWPALFPSPSVPPPPAIPVTLVMQPPPSPKAPPQPAPQPLSGPKHEVVSGPDQETTAPVKPEEKGPEAAPKSENNPPPLPTDPHQVAAIPEPKPKPPEPHPPKPKVAPRVTAPQEVPRGSVERAPGEALRSGDPYLNELWALIESHRFYPANAIGSLGLPLEGTARFLIAIRSDGVLQGVRLESSTGADALDRAALKMIQDAAPFPPPPPATYPPPGVVLEVTIHLFPGAS